MKYVIVTGATRGLGLAIARKLSDDGYGVIASGRALTTELESLCNQNGKNVIFQPFDMNETDKIHDFVKSLNNHFGHPWGLVNNAALGNDGILATQHERDIASLIRVNLEAPILMTKYVSRSMFLERGGRIVNISSIIATTGFSGLSVYAATKSALIGFTRSLAREVGKAGITVNAIAPGYMETDMTTGLQGERLATIKRRSPLGKLANPVDVANAVCFLMSEHASSITGTTLTVDAGSTA